MGFSLGEILLLIVVGIIVVGPKRLPGVMRTAGQWIGKLRRMSSDLRSQSGIDDILRQEGLEQHLHELRSLSRLNVVDTLMAPGVAAAQPGPLDTFDTASGRPLDRSARLPLTRKPREPLRDREYPVVGCDAYGAVPDDAAMYLPAARSPAAAEKPTAPEPVAAVVDAPVLPDAPVPPPPADADAPAPPEAEAHS